MARITAGIIAQAERALGGKFVDRGSTYPRLKSAGTSKVAEPRLD